MRMRKYELRIFSHVRFDDEIIYIYIYMNEENMK